MDDIERFSDDESATAIFPDRPTLAFRPSAGLLHSAGGITEAAPGAPAPAACTEPPHMELADAEKEAEFWDSAPRYSTTSVRPPPEVTLPPPRQPNRSRRVLARVLFSALFLGAIGLLGYEASMAYASRSADAVDGSSTGVTPSPTRLANQ
jgi:hypothetical protein